MYFAFSRPIAATAAQRCLPILLLAATVALPPAIPVGAAEKKPSASSPYRLVFEGNENLSSAALRQAAAEELAAFERSEFRRSDIDDAAYQMELAYRRRGYAFAEVDYRIQDSPLPTIVTFTVSEGPQVLIERVSFSGNRAVDEERLHDFVKPPQKGMLQGSKDLFVEAQIAGARAEMEDYYISIGFRDASIAAPEIAFFDDRRRARISFAVYEGPLYRIRAVKVAGDIPPQISGEIDAVRAELVDQPYLVRSRVVLQSRLLNIYQEVGYAYATVAVSESVDSESGDVVLTAVVNSGPVVTIAEIEVRGNRKNRDAAIREHLRLQVGDRYSGSKQRESFRSLYRTGLFSKVDLKLEPLQDRSKARLVVVVAENPTIELYLEPGWGSYEKLRLKVGFRENSFMGTGIVVNPEVSVSGKAQSATVRFTDPWFWGTDITADLPTYYNRREEPSFTRQDLGFAVYFSKNLAANWKTTVGYNLRTTDVSDVAPDALDQVTDSDYDFGSVEGQVTYDSRDDIFFPLRGKRFYIAAEAADRLLGGSISLLRLTGGLRFFHRILPATVLGVRYKTGLLLPGSDEAGLPIAERFFNGGENTVRSYKESELGPVDAFGEPVGGYGYNVFNIELRRRIYGSFIAAAFVDIGNIAPNQSRFEQGLPPYTSSSDIVSDTLADFFSDMRAAVGIGLQYLLPVGPLRLDLAFNPDVDQSRDEDEFVLHVSVGTAF